MTLASILGFAVSRHLGLTQRMLATQETGTGAMGQISLLLKAVIATSLTMQALPGRRVPPALPVDGH